MTWPMVTVDSIKSKEKYSLVGGPFGSNLSSKHYVDEGVPVIRGANLPAERKFSFDDFVWVSEQKADSLIQNTAYPGDVVFTQRGTLGQVGLIPPDSTYSRFIISQSQMKLTVDERIASAEYVYYVFSSKEYQSIIQNHSITSGVPHINLGILKNIQIPLPPLKIQGKIANILNAYDDLIENNRRRIQLLEESARLLYREWFVHLRFPGHEHVKVVDGVPEEWKKTTISEVADTIGGGTPSTKVEEYWNEGDVTWFAPRDLTNNDSVVLLDSEKKITELGLKKSSAKMLPPETILMTSRASIGFFGLYEGEACTNQGFISVIPKHQYSKMYLLHNLMRRVEEIKGLAGGTTFKEINKTTFRAMDIVLPEEGVRNEFEEFAYDIIRQVRIIKKQTKKLEEARDLLLPRLMNGDIAV